MRLLPLLLSTLSYAAPPAEIVDLLNKYNSSMKISETADGKSMKGCPLTKLILEVTDPVTNTPGFVQAHIYKTDKSDRSIILLPPTGGENILDQWYANYLCSAGFQVVLLQTWAHQTEAKLDMGMHDEGAQRSLAAIRHVLDYLKPQRPNQVGILGTSVGALSSTLALGFEPRLSTAVLIVGGTGQAEIIGRSTEATAAKLREARMKEFHYQTVDEYVAALQQRVKIDPTDFVDFTGPKKVLAFVGLKDVTVPTKNQKELVALFHAESVEYEGDHLATIKNTAWHSDQISAFFEKNLK